MNRSTNKGEDLTKDELDWIMHALENEAYCQLCPDCRGGHLLKGPCGGAAQNMMCENCTSEFNLVLGPGFVIGDRISDRGDGGARKELYGLCGTS
jgi:hypothetical protein